MSEQHLIIGSGSVGAAVVAELVGRGAEVVVVTRHGSGPDLPQVRRVAADASSLDALLAAAPRATAIYNCANPRYFEWPRDWPPMAKAFLAFAERTGAVLATTSNLYGYGPVDVPMVETLPLAATDVKGRLRAEMWLEAKALNDAGRIRATEVRGSDYLAASEQSRIASSRVVPRVLAGRSVLLLGNVNTPHTWTSTTDVARTLVAAAADERAWGKAWHVPSNAPRTQRQVVDDLADAAGVKHVRVSEIPHSAVWAMGVFSPLMREFRATAYQMQRPYILDDRAARAEFGIEPTPWETLLDQVIAHYKRG